MSLRTLGKNTAIYAIGNIGLRAASFLVIPLYAHALSISDFGLLTLLLATVQVMIILMSCGMRTTLIRFYKEFEQKKNLNNLLCTTSFINLIAGLIVAILSFIFFPSFFRNVLHTKDVTVYLVLACGAALAHSQCHHYLSYYRVGNKAIKFMIISVMSSLLLLITTSLFLYIFKLGIIGAMVAYIITYSALLLFLLIDVLPKIGISISITTIPRFLRFGFPFIFSMSGQFIMGGASLFFLSSMVALEIVGIYSIGYKLSQIIYIIIILPFQLAFEPYLLTNLDDVHIKEKVGKTFIYLIVGMILMSFCIVLASRVLMPLIAPPEYSSAFSVMLLLLPIMLLNGVYVFGEAVVIAKNKTIIIGAVMAACAFLTIVINYLLIPFFNWYGSVIASGFTFLLAAFTLVFIGIREFKITIKWKNIIIPGFIYVVFLISEFFIQKQNNVVFYMLTTGFATLAFVSVYFSPVCDDPERQYLKSMAVKIKSFFIHEPAEVPE